ncbi:MAG: hypothetical protein MPW15_13710 [Candidatus Manganitrophus sp.]|nr:hypothetical protein [Candidatus Manganitrophus sp.]
MIGYGGTNPFETLMTETKQAEVTRKEINYQLFDFVGRYSRRIEFAADQIAGATSDPKVQYQSLLWKLHAVPCLPGDRAPGSGGHPG